MSKADWGISEWPSGDEDVPPSPPKRARSKPASAQKGLPPTHTLNALHKWTGDWAAVGVGWVQPDGSIRVKLNPGVCLAYSNDIVLTLFPRGDDSTPGPRKDG